MIWWGFFAAFVGALAGLVLIVRATRQIGASTPFTHTTGRPSSIGQASIAFSSMTLNPFFLALAISLLAWVQGSPVLLAPTIIVGCAAMMSSLGMGAQAAQSLPVIPTAPKEFSRAIYIQGGMSLIVLGSLIYFLIEFQGAS